MIFKHVSFQIVGTSKGGVQVWSKSCNIWVGKDWLCGGELTCFRCTTLFIDIKVQFWVCFEEGKGSAYWHSHGKRWRGRSNQTQPGSSLASSADGYGGASHPGCLLLLSTCHLLTSSHNLVSCIKLLKLQAAVVQLRGDFLCTAVWHQRGPLRPR